MPQTPSPLVFAAPLATAPASPAEGPGAEGVFDFDDVRAMREEYEERIHRLERERDAAVEVLRKDADNRIAQLTEDNALRASSDARARQELIEDLTHELAAAREEGELHARDADKRRDAAEARLLWAAEQLQRLAQQVDQLQGELARTAAVLNDGLASVLAPAAVPAPAVQAALPPVAVLRAANGDRALAQTSPPTADAYGKRRKIRLR